MLAVLIGFVAALTGGRTIADETSFPRLQEEYQRTTHSLLKRYCIDCHSAADKQGELDLEQFTQFEHVRQAPAVWQKVAEMLDNGEMPPKDADQPTTAERRELRNWIERYLGAEARANAGDPGPVVLRRLTNAEYTYTVRDLTGAPLEPAREFPADGAAGEGFTNAGAAMAMSPALLQKYLDAGKDIASHAVLLPGGIRFSPSVTPRDWTEETLAAIHQIYDRYTEAKGATAISLQGIALQTNAGGRLPIEAYLAATLQERDALRAGRKSIAEVARERRLSPKYLGTLWGHLNDDTAQPPSQLLNDLRTKWHAATPANATDLVHEVSRWQRALFRFTTVGHIGKTGGPKAWMEPLSPLVARHELRHKLVVPDGKGEVVVYLSTSDAGDSGDGDFVVWERPRLVAPGRDEILLKDLRATTARLTRRREELIESTARCLEAAGEASAREQVDVPSLAAKHKVDTSLLAAWLDFLGIGSPAGVGTPLGHKIESVGGHGFIQGWGGDNALSVLANASGQHVRVPGNMPAHSVAVHPAPTVQVTVGWMSPVLGDARISARVQDAHPECGNGIHWQLEVRRGKSVQRLAEGTSRGATPAAIGPFERLPIRPGDFVALVIAPREGNHSCDLTNVDLTITSAGAEWNLSNDVSSDILAANPHSDRQGHPGVWHFFGEPVSKQGGVIPAGSILSSWLTTSDLDLRKSKATDLQNLLTARAAGVPNDSPDALLARELTSLNGSLLRNLLNARKVPGDASPPAAGDSAIGLDPALFGQHVDGSPIDAASLCIRAPSVLEVRIPAELANGAELVASCLLHEASGPNGSAQTAIVTTPPAAGLQPGEVADAKHPGVWTSSAGSPVHSSPILTSEGSIARARFETAFDDFRSIFPPALCYSKIVPVDEVVTLTQFYREDEPLRRLMLSDEESSRLDALWAELHFVSREPLTQVDALQQLMEFATQDGDPTVFEPLRKPTMERAAAFRQQLANAEPAHLDAVLELASRAWRRPLSSRDSENFRALDARLRAEGVAHDDSVRLLIARVFASPSFLYRPETAPPGDQPGPVTDHELATRLSYFLWSSVPDAELRRLADAGRLHDPEVLAAQTERMLKDDRVQRLATEFGCQWLQVYDFDRDDGKSDRHFPEFKELRGDMYQEVVRYFTHLFQENRPVTEIYSSDYTFVNGRLAAFYNFAGLTVPETEWRKVESTDAWGRGGILTQAATLAKNSGASRTSPILRGNWVSEVLLGERLPRPPKDVPPLPDEQPAADVTVRQLIEQHTSDERCARCHVRIDPFGFALEGFDGIGRRRTPDSPALLGETTSKLADGTELVGVRGLTRYLLVNREDAVLRQFCRKLLGYALGRSVQLSDHPLISEMCAELRKSDFRVSAAVQAIVQSRQFRERRGMDSARASDEAASAP
ncbi:hypothetical protein Pan44_50350 [Caulifigura coniformis]|uniref:Planctomycete cytochrome C n=1 Tax=Caulifigura coniformis TaxID=2527983 RepID=A0A517SLH2_9PLAN|nr:DUF1592 domain-containing protein [Caulifigura coniformis]QDT56972.1 hypothetical protein Pan44_50350 [Caulifigura coniformis]